MGNGEKTNNRKLNVLAIAVLLSIFNSNYALAADVVPDKTNGKNPVVVQAGNGVPVVNIRNPNANGLSHNQYKQFNVNKEGLIFNNIRNGGSAQTQLGGYITGNTNLTREASTILNEVISNMASKLNGFMEVAGQKANVIIANPNGIQVGNSGFINANNATLTTGRPLLDAEGNLTGYNIDRGKIEVTDLGLDLRTATKADILARAIAVNAKIFADRLNMVTGKNEVDTEGNVIRVLDDKEDTEIGVQLDVGAVGGMYCGVLKLIGTAKGLGVNMDGEIYTQKQLLVDNAGNVYWGQPGKVRSDGDMDIKVKGDFTNAGEVTVQGKLNVEAQNVTNSGKVFSEKDIAIRTAGNHINLGEIATNSNYILNAYNADNSGTTKVVGNGVYTVKNAIDNTGTLETGGTLTANATSFSSNSSTAKVQSAGEMAITLSGNFANVGLMTTGKTLKIEAKDFTNNAGEIISTEATNITANGKLTNSGKIASNDTLDITAKDVTNSGDVVGIKDIKLKSDKDVVGCGNIATNGNLTLEATGLVNVKDMTAGGLLNIRTTGDINLTGTTQSGSKAEIVTSAGDFSNTGNISTRDTLILSAVNIANGIGKIVSDSTMTLKSNGAVVNDGAIGTNSNLKIEADSVETRGEITSQGKLDVAVKNITNSGKVTAGDDLDIKATGSYSNTGAISTNKNYTLNALSVTDGGTIKVVGNMTYTVDNKVDNTGTMEIGGDYIVTAKELANAATGKIQTLGKMDVTVSQTMGNKGQVTSNKTFVLVAQDLLNDNGKIVSGETNNISVGNSIINSGSIATNDTLTIAAQTLTNTGEIIGLKGTDITTEKEITGYGDIATNDNLNLKASGIEAGNVTAGKAFFADVTKNFSVTGTMQVTNKAEIKVGENFTNTGNISVGDALNLSAVNITNGTGKIVSEKDSTITATGKLINEGQIGSNGALNITADSMVTSGGIISVGNSIIHADNSITSTGKIQTNGSMDITAAKLDSATLIAGQTVGLNIVGDTKIMELLQGGSDMNIETGGSFTVEGESNVLSGGTLFVKANTLANGKGRIVSEKDATYMVAGAFTNGGMVGTNSNLSIDAASMSTAGTLLSIKDMSLTLDSTLTSTGAIYANGSMEIAAEAVESKILTAGKDLKITATNNIVNNQLIQSVGKAEIITTGGDFTNNGDVSVGDTLGISAINVTNGTGKIVSEGDGTYTIAGSFANSGLVGTNGKLGVTAASLNSEGQIVSGSDSTIDVTGGEFKNNILQAGGNLKVDAAKLDSKTIVVGGTVEANITGNMNVTNLLKSNGVQNLTVGGSFTNAFGSQIVAVDDIVITATDTFTNNGVIFSEADIDFQAKALTNKGSIINIATGKINTAGAITNDGEISSTGNLTVESTGLTNNGRLIVGQLPGINGIKEMLVGMTVAESGDVRIINHGDFINNGDAFVNGSIDLTAEGKVDNNGKIVSEKDVTFDADGVLTNTGTIGTNGNIELSAKAGNFTAGSVYGLGTGNFAFTDSFVNGSSITILKTMDITAASYNNSGEIYSGGNSTNTVTNDFINSGKLLSGGTLDISSKSFENKVTGQIAGEGKTTIDIENSVINKGTVSSNADLELSAALLTNEGSILGITRGKIDVEGKVNNSGEILSNGNLNIEADELETKTILAGGKLDVTANGKITNNSKMQSGGIATVITDGDFTNKGELVTGNNLTLTADNIINNSKITVNGNTTITAQGNFTNTGAQIAANGDLKITSGGEVTSTGTEIFSYGQSTFDFKQGKFTNSSKITAGNGLTLDTKEFVNSGEIVSGNKGIFTVTNDFDNKAEIATNGDLGIKAKRFATNRKLTSGGTLTLHSDSSYTNSVVLTSVGDLKIETAGLTVNNEILAVGKGDFVIAGAFINNSNIRVDNNLTLSADSITNPEGKNIIAGGKANITATKGALTNAGTILSNGIGTYSVFDVITNTGSIKANAGIDVLKAKSLTNSGTFAGTGKSSYTITGDFNNTGLVNAADNEITAKNFSNTEGGRVYGDNLTIIVTNTINNTAEVGATKTPIIAARNNLTLNAVTVNNKEHATLLALNDLGITATTLNNNSATIEAGNNMTLNVGTLNNTNEHFATEKQVVDTENIYEIVIGSTHYRVNTLDGVYDGGDYVLRRDRTHDKDDNTWTGYHEIWGGGPYLISYDKTDEYDFWYSPGDRGYNLSYYVNSFECTSNWEEHVYVRTTKEDIVIKTDPGKIVAGRNVDIRGELVTNDKSFVVAGGTFTAQCDSLDNVDAGMMRYFNRSGTQYRFVSDWDDYWYTIRTPNILDVDEPSVNIDYGYAGSKADAGTYNLDEVISSGTSGSSTITDKTRVDVTASGATSNAYTNSKISVAGVDNKASLDVSKSLTRLNLEASDKTMTLNNASSETSVRVDGVVTQDSTEIRSSQGEKVAVDKQNTKSNEWQTNTVKGDKIDVDKQKTNISVIQPMDISSSVIRITSSLYTQATPDAKYYIETDPEFANFDSWLSSDYFFNQMSTDPDKVAKRLGDAYYEQNRIKEQIINMTGQRYLTGYTSDEAQYQTLMDNAVKFANMSGAQVGVALTAEQRSQLTEPVVWMELSYVELSGGNTVVALVPKVYLPDDYAQNHSNAVMSGMNVNLLVKDDIVNTGNITAIKQLDLSAENITDLYGFMKGETVQIAARNNITAEGSTILAEKAAILQAGNNIDLKTVTNSTVFQGGSMQVLNKQLLVSVTGADGKLVIDAGKNVNLQAVNIFATGEQSTIDVMAGNDVKLTAIEISSTRNTKFGNADSNEYHVKGIGTNISSNGTLNMGAGNDVILQTANVVATGENAKINIGAVGNISLTTSTAKQGSYRDISHGFIKDNSSTDEGSNLISEGQINLIANKDINAKAAYGDAKELNLTAGKNINIAAGDASSYYEYFYEDTDSGFFSSETTTIHDIVSKETKVGTDLGGDKVTLRAGGDLNVKGSNVIGTGDVNLIATKDTNIDSVTERTGETHIHKVVKSGLLSGGGFGITIGTKSTLDETQQQTATQKGSIIGSVEGDVNIITGENLNVKASDIIAGGNINLTGSNVNVEAGADNTQYQYRHEEKMSGLSISLGGGVVGTVQENIVKPLERANTATNDKLSALSAIKAASKIKETAGVIDAALGPKTVTQYTGNLDVAENGAMTMGEKQVERKQPNIVNLSIGYGSSKSVYTEDGSSSTAVSSGISAGKDVNVTAVEKDINIKGSEVTGENVTLTAKGDINITAAANTNKVESNEEKSSGGFGVSVGTTGTFSVYAKSQKSNTDTDQNISGWTQSNVTAKDTLTLTSGADANIIGSKVKGEKVNANIGGDMNIASLQDTDNYKSNSSSYGFSITSEIGGATNFSVNGNKSKMNSEYSSVTDQAGIYAGNRGFDINVANNTDLKGAVIDSTATGDKNTLITGTISFDDIRNKAEYDSSGYGFSYSGERNKDKKEQNILKQGDKGFIPNIPMGSSDEDSSTTKSAIADGTIVLTKPSEQKQDVTQLNRNTQDTLNKLDKIFDKKEIEEKQELAGLFSELSFNAIHDLSKNWSTEQKAMAHAAVGYISAELAGSKSSFSTALAAGVNKFVTEEILKDDKKRLYYAKHPEELQWLSAALGATIGQMAGDAGSGASIAASATKNNRLNETQYEAYLKELEAAGNNPAKIKAVLETFTEIDKANEAILAEKLQDQDFYDGLAVALKNNPNLTEYQGVIISGKSIQNAYSGEKDLSVKYGGVDGSGNYILKDNKVAVDARDAELRNDIGMIALDYGTGGLSRGVQALFKIYSAGNIVYGFYDATKNDDLQGQNRAVIDFANFGIGEGIESKLPTNKQWVKYIISGIASTVKQTGTGFDDNIKRPRQQ